MSTTSLSTYRLRAAALAAVSILVIVAGALVGSRFSAVMDSPRCIDAGTCSWRLVSVMQTVTLVATCVGILGVVVAIALLVRTLPDRSPRWSHHSRLRYPWIAAAAAVVVMAVATWFLLMAVFAASFFGAAAFVAAIAGALAILAVLPALTWWYWVGNPRRAAATVLIGTLATAAAAVAMVWLFNVIDWGALTPNSEWIVTVAVYICAIGGTAITHYRAMTWDGVNKSLAEGPGPCLSIWL
ncbi:MAG: hypothetical protein LKI24_17005 [Acidipropionibacterium sp.]|jgi:MFS family permease|nr:hypothetical protein [Acidipropionibacterium sp.]